MGLKTAGETLLFDRWRQGDENVVDDLLPRLYDELRSLAARRLGRERRDHTLQPTELVNEALIRLLGAQVHPNDRTHFFALAAQTMRRVLVDHARRQRADKRLAAKDRVTLSTAVTPALGPEVDVVELHEALERLARVAPRAAQVVELRYFGGLLNREVAEVLAVSEATVERDWKTARVWLRQELEP